MATTSTIAAARATLVDLIAAALPTVQVCYGFPTAETQQRELIVLAGSTTGTSEDIHLKAGRRTRGEMHDSTIVVLVASQPNPRLSEARAADLAATVEDILATDPKLGGVSGLIAGTLRGGGRWRRVRWWRRVFGDTTPYRSASRGAGDGSRGGPSHHQRRRGS